MGDREVVWSYGGGVQSVRLLTLILEGKLPAPARIVMADTGRERQAVWDYTKELVIPALRSIGRRLEIVPHDYAAVDLVAHNGDLVLPVYFSENGQAGKLPTFCSDEWKQRPVRRYLREQGHGPGNPITMWFGMSLDEVGRMRKADVKWIDNYYPLCQDPAVRQRRHECAIGIRRFGWPVPPSSACWMCPNRDDPTWKEMRDHEPDDFGLAVRLERILTGAGWGDIYFHRSLKPLDAVDFEGPSQQPGLFDGCATWCWT
jgi:hypothetical protein